MTRALDSAGHSVLVYVDNQTRHPLKVVDKKATDGRWAQEP